MIDLVTSTTMSRGASGPVRQVDIRVLHSTPRVLALRQRHPHSREPAGEFVRGCLAGQVETLRQLDARVRADRPDAVHQLRVVTRRLRSLLASFEPVFDRSETRRLRAELAWLTRAAGDARDAEVLHSRLLQRIDGHPRRSKLNGLRAHVDATLVHTHERAHEELVAAMSSPRYQRLVESLVVFVADPPWGPEASAPAAVVLPVCLRHDWRRLRRCVRRAAIARSASKRAARLHDVRKAAKRTRYAAEAVAPMWGSDACRFASAVEALQTVLGERRDDLMADERLWGFAAEAGSGRDHVSRIVLSSHDPRSFERAYDAAWRRANSKKLRRWFV